jgi:putative transposase
VRFCEAKRIPLWHISRRTSQNFPFRNCLINGERRGRWLTLRPMRIYPTDLSDAQFSHIEPHLPAANQRGRPRIHGPREILNAVFYVLKSGCPWRLLPREFPPWRTVYHWFRAWRINGTWERLNAALRERLRARLGKTPQPSAGIVDSQSVKTTGVGGNERGFDPAKKVEGRKRHLLVDTEGFVLEARVHNAKVPDEDGIRLLLKQVRERFPHLSHLWVDAGYQGRGRTWAEEVWGVSVEVVRKPPKPVPEEVAKAWARECGPRKARRWTGRGSCRSEASRCCLAGGWWSAPSPG